MNKILTESKQKNELGFYPSKLAGISLPVSNPKRRFYERDNGRDKIALASGEWQNPKTGKLEDAGLPYGIIPRHIFVYLSQEYHRNKTNGANPRIIQFPTTIPEFLKKLGYTKGGETYKAIYQQTLKLFNAKIIICRKEKNYILKKQNIIAEQVALWWDPKEPQKQSLFNSMVEISKMVEEMIKDVLPLRLDTIRKIGRNCLEFDLYSWLNYRHYSFTNPYTISWKALHEQFGANYKNKRMFKLKVKKAFVNVLKLYEHNSKLTKSGILLQNSKTDIEPQTSSIRKVEHRAEQTEKAKQKTQNAMKKVFGKTLF